MKQLLFAFCLLLGIQNVFSQEILAQLELGSRDPKPDYCEYVTEDQGIITMGPMSTASSRNVGIVKYDANFKRQWVKAVVELNPRKTVDFMAVIGENIFVFVSEFIPREKVIKTFYYQYNINGKVITTDEVLAVYPNQQEQKVLLEYQLSPNKKKLLIYKNLQNRRENEQLLYYLIDETGALVQNGEIKLKYPDEKFSTVDLQVSNNGNVFLLGKFYDASNVRSPMDYKYLIINHNLKTEQDTEFPINGGTKFINNLAFRIDRDENIYVSGFYSNKGTDKIIGTVFQKIGTDNKLIINVSEPFSEAFLSRFLSNGQIERGKELNNFYMHSDDDDHGIVLRSDGGVMLAAERYYVTTQSYRDYYGYWVTRNIYHYDEIILTSISPDGKIEWQEMIDKTQQGEVRQQLSFFSAVGESGMYLIYEYAAHRQKTSLYYNMADLKGKVTQIKPLTDDYKWGNEFYPNDCDQITNNEVLLKFYENNGRGLQIWKVKLK